MVYLKQTKNINMIKSPINYTGNKFSILNQLLPLFPNNINTFIDLFAGSCTVSVNASANNFLINDNITELIDLYGVILSTPTDILLEKINSRIDELSLSKTNEDGYLQLRREYNSIKNPLDLFILSAYSFNHTIRFNNKKEFNSPFGRERSQYNKNIERNLILFSEQLKEMNPSLCSLDYSKLDISSLSKFDFVYCDPPYLITTATYNDGKRGFKGWNQDEERKLLGLLDNLNENNIKFGLSNVLSHNGVENTIINNWLRENNFNVHQIEKNYRNSSYNKKHRGISIEVLITNY